MRYVLVTFAQSFPQDTLKKMRHLGCLKYLKEVGELYSLLVKTNMLNCHPRILNNVDDKMIWPEDSQFIISLPFNANTKEIAELLLTNKLIQNAEPYDPYLSKIRLQNYSYPH